MDPDPDGVSSGYHHCYNGYTLQPPVSSALMAKQRLHRTEGALGGLSDGADGSHWEEWKEN